MCYLRDSSFAPELGLQELRACHEGLRATALQLEKGYRSLIVPAWTQLAYYSDGSGYRWHRDGLQGHLQGPIGWYYWLQRGAVRRRKVTAIVYFNSLEWPKSCQGALRCRAPVAGWDSKEILPIGGRLVLFDSHQVEHEVAGI